MSTSTRPHERRTLDAAIENMDDAIDGLDQENVFSLGDLSAMERELLDMEAIADRAAELETALDIAADVLTGLIDPAADDALSLDEILARYVHEVVGAQSVEAAGKLLECLGSKGSGPGDQGLGIGQEISYDSLKKLVADLRKIAEHLVSEVPGQHELGPES